LFFVFPVVAALLLPPLLVTRTSAAGEVKEEPEPSEGQILDKQGACALFSSAGWAASPRKGETRSTPPVQSGKFLSSDCATPPACRPLLFSSDEALLLAPGALFCPWRSRLHML